MMFSRFAIITLALVGAACATTTARDTQRVGDVCQFVRDVQSYQGQAVILTARIVDAGPHGWFIEDSNCPSQILQIYPASDPTKRTLSALGEASNRSGVKPFKLATIRGTVELNKGHTQGIGSDRLLPMLKVTEVIGWEAISE
jgi:hypothetical protein